VRAQRAVCASTTAPAHWLLEGRIDASDGGASGDATLRGAGLPALALQWRPHADTPRAWQVDWRGEAPDAPNGTLLLQATPAGADWQLEAQVPALQAGGIALSGLTLSASGSSDLFEGIDPLATATSLAARRQGGTPARRGELAMHRCAADCSSPCNPRLQVPACDAALAGATLALAAPLALEARRGARAAAARHRSRRHGEAARTDAEAAWTVEDLSAEHCRRARCGHADATALANWAPITDT